MRLSHLSQPASTACGRREEDTRQYLGAIEPAVCRWGDRFRSRHTASPWDSNDTSSTAWLVHVAQSDDTQIVYMCPAGIELSQWPNNLSSLGIVYFCNRSETKGGEAMLKVLG